MSSAKRVLTFKTVEIGNNPISGPGNWVTSKRYAVLADGIEVGFVDKMSRMWLYLSAKGITTETGWSFIYGDSMGANFAGTHSLIHQTRKSASRHFEIDR